MFSNCFSFIFEIEPFTLNPANNIDAAPATPKIVINILFLYLNIFRAVTFCVNFILFQIGVILSNNIFEPAFGALGCNKLRSEEHRPGCGPPPPPRSPAGCPRRPRRLRWCPRWGPHRRGTPAPRSVGRCHTGGRGTPCSCPH